LNLVAQNAQIGQTKKVDAKSCRHHADVKFISCALGSKVQLIVSGDKHLLEMDGFRKISVIKPQTFLADYIK